MTTTQGLQKHHSTGIDSIGFDSSSGLILWTQFAVVSLLQPGCGSSCLPLLWRLQEPQMKKMLAWAILGETADDKIMKRGFADEL